MELSNYRPDRDAEPEAIAPGLYIDLPGWLDIFSEPGPGRFVSLRLNWHEGSVKPIAVTVTSADGRPIVGADLRGVRLQDLVRSHLPAWVTWMDGFGVDPSWQGSEEPLPDDVHLAGRMKLGRDEAELMRLRGPVPESLAKVARLYNLAKALGSAPSQYVQQAVGISSATAGRWIRSARELGYLDGND